MPKVTFELFLGPCEHGGFHVVEVDGNEDKAWVYYTNQFRENPKFEEERIALKSGLVETVTVEIEP
jgi:hypothetical protein